MIFIRQHSLRFSLTTAVAMLSSLFAVAQPGEKRIQYPWGLKNSYFGINIGYINYPFSALQPEPGYSVEKVTVPHIAPRITLYGHQFNKYLSAQITYMRPVDWVIYNNINGDKKPHSVWMNVAGLTVSTNLPLSKKFSLFAEGGLGIVTRKGFVINNKPVIKDATIATLLTGVALQYHLNSKWSLDIGTTWSPADAKNKQPATSFFSAGFKYRLKELAKEKVASNSKSGYYFARHILQVSYTTNALNYGVNDLFSKTLPLFWGGAAHVKRGFSLHYQRNIFHARKVFSMDWAAGIGLWKSRNKGDEFFTLSLYPVLRFTAFRSPKTDLFFEYTVAGPTLISKTLIDNETTGRHFTFYDAMGLGIITGKKKKLTAGIRIAHFSNGNLFPQNDGVKVPLTFSLGYVLK
jgi:hypothetical protein